MEHTKEPLRIGIQEEGVTGPTASPGVMLEDHGINKLEICAGKEVLFHILHDGEPITEEQKANARRLVACWNACDGLQTDSLETSRGLAGAVEGVFIAKSVIIEQRDKLLTAAKEHIAAGEYVCTAKDDVLAMVRFGEAELNLRTVIAEVEAAR